MPSNPSEQPDCVLSALALVGRLAEVNAVGFDRASARLALREQFATPAGSIADRLTRFQHVLTACGLVGRVRQLSLADALDACRGGETLVAPLAGASHDRAWVLVCSAARSKVRVACQHGADLWITQQRLIDLLDVGDTQTPLPWLITEPALPCSPSGTAAVSSVADPDEHDDHAALPSPFRRLITILRPEASDIWVVTIFSAIVGLLALATPVTVEALVNTVAFGSLMQPVVVLSLVLFGFLGFAAAIRVLQAYIGEVIQRRLFVRVVADLSQRLPRVRQDAYEGTHGPELLNRFFDVMTVQKSAALLVLEGIAIILQTAVGMTVLAFYHPLLLGFDIALLAALAFIVIVLGRGGVATSIEESKAKYAVAAWLEQLALCPLTFKNAGGADRASEHADQLAIAYLRARQDHFAVLIRQIAFTLGLQALAGSVLLGVGGWLVIQGQLTLGQLVAAELIVALLVGSFTKLGKHLEAYYDLLAAVDKLGHLFDLPVERQSGEMLPVTMRGLPVRLGDQAIAPGEIVALVGPPGSGKSRLLAAAFGLSQAERGGPLIAGAPVNALEAASLRAQVALVRHCEIFAGTLGDNVHLGRAGVTLADVRRCLEELGMGDELCRLTEGLETVLQPGGIPLTDAQARCVVLARALLGQPRLLLIDSLLDGLPDAVLPDVLQALSRRTSATTIVIATGRGDIARLCHRVIPVAAPPLAANAPLSADAQHTNVTTHGPSLA
jgi:ABC-type bacteriocin/lantibiotic exporter with double-glycine peptidase domain